MSVLRPADFDVAADTDVGQRRTVDQDSADAFIDSAGRFAVAIVCDGIGGLALGEVASRQVVDTVRRGMDGCGREPRECLDEAILTASKAILEASSWWQRMGTTAVAVLCTESGFEVVHAGDSRAYRVRNGNLELLTTDHSWVMEQVQAGRMSIEEAESDSRRNVITRAVGTDENLSLDWREKDALEPGDILFACSDGLHGPLTDAEIESAFRGVGDSAQAVARLIERANDHGGPDNIGVAMVRVPA